MVVTPLEIRQLLARRPFIPLRIHMTDGSLHEIHHPELVLVLKQRIDIGVRPDKDGILTEVEYCSLLHVVRIEEITDAA